MLHPDLELKLRSLKPLPPSSLDKLAVGTYLFHMHAKLSLSLHDHEIAAQCNPSKQLKGQINYIKTQLAVLNWLQSVNDQRKVANEDS